MAKKTLLPYSFSFKAQKDLDRATLWYNDQRWMLGLEFVDFIQKKILHIRKYPGEFMFISNKVQRAILNKYPYVIFFTLEENTIIILRIRHKKQYPLIRFK
mgnify:CR=1 FL=1